MPRACFGTAGEFLGEQGTAMATLCTLGSREGQGVSLIGCVGRMLVENSGSPNARVRLAFL